MFDCFDKKPQQICYSFANIGVLVKRLQENISRLCIVAPPIKQRIFCLNLL